MTNLVEHFEEEILSLSRKLDGAIERRLDTQQAIDNYKKTNRHMSIEQKMKILKIIEGKQ